MKKIICFILAICLFIPNHTVVAESVELSIDEEYRKINNVEIQLQDIPVFITNTKNMFTLSNAQKKDISNKIREYQNMSIDNNLDLQNNMMQNRILSIEDYTIYQLNDLEKQMLSSSPIYSMTLDKIKEIISSGLSVEYINLYMPNISFGNNSVSLNASGDPDDASFWEDSFPVFRIYDGYKLLYSETDVYVSTDPSEPDNISSGLNWEEILKMTIESFCDRYVKSEYFDSIKTFSEALSKFTQLYSPPLKINYGGNSEWLKTHFSGSLYIKEVYISDNLDRIDGYAYYPWARLESLEVRLITHARYPYSITASGKKEYIEEYITSSEKNVWTPGYLGASFAVEEIIDLYESTHVFIIYEEFLDIQSILSSLV